MSAEGKLDFDKLRNSGFEGELQFRPGEVVLDPVSGAVIRPSVGPHSVTTVTAPTWTPVFTPAGIDYLSGGNNITSLAVFNGQLVAGGVFAFDAGVPAAATGGIAAWDGAGWKPLGAGLNGSVSVLCVAGSDLIAGGGFTSSNGTSLNHIAKWNGSSWGPLGSGLSGGNGSVEALVSSGGLLYAGGDFTQAGGNSAANVAVWDGASWSQAGNGLAARVNDLEMFGTTLYAAGEFAGGVRALQSGVWNVVGGGTNQSAQALQVWGGNLVVGGGFTTVGGGAITVNRIAAWSGSAWAQVGSGLGTGTESVRRFGISPSGDLVASGTFSGGVAQYVGGFWQTVDQGLSPTSVQAIASYAGELVLAGGFTAENHNLTPLRGIARWTGSTWKVMGQGVEGTHGWGLTTVPGAVNAMTLFQGSVACGGAFLEAGAKTVNRVGLWNDATGWSAFGSGVATGPLPGQSGSYPAEVLAMAVYNGRLVIGGVFLQVGGTSCDRIAAWNGTSWSALGSGLNGTVTSLQVVGSDLYAGGSFTLAGGVSAKGVAKWNDTNWSALGAGIPTGGVFALATDGTKLYVGGSFAQAGSQSASNIAAYTPSTNAWAALGAGVNGKVNALIWRKSKLYVGGEFTTAGGATASRLASWDGSAWSDVIGGVTGSPSPRVLALADYHGALIVGGVFTTVGAGAGALACANVARCDDTAGGEACSATGWSVLAGATNGVDASEVRSLLVVGGRLFVGGQIGRADVYLVNHLAVYEEPDVDIVPPATVSDLTHQGRGTTTAVLLFTEPGDDGFAGDASELDIRWSTDRMLTVGTFLSTGVAIPTSIVGGGTQRCVQVTGLPWPNTKYYFRMRALDDACNYSGLSKLDSMTTRASGSSIEVTCNFGPISATGPGTTGIAFESGGLSPSRGRLLIKLELGEETRGGRLEIDLFDVGGRRVSGVSSEGVEPGPYQFELGGGGESASIAPGTYFVRARVGELQAKRMVIVLR